MFDGLGAVAEAILASLEASRARPGVPRHQAVADAAASAARERAEVEWGGRLERLRRVVAELSAWSGDARQAANGAERRPDAAAAAPFGAEAARLGEAAQVIAAALAAVRSVREALGGQPAVSAQAHAERMAPRWAELEALLAGLEAGSPVPASAVDAALAAVRAEGGAAAAVHGGALLAAAAEVRSALGDVSAAPGAPAPGANARLERAASFAAGAGGEAAADEAGPAAPLAARPAPAPAARPATAVPKQPAGTARALRDEGHEPGPAEGRRGRAEGRPRPERPATWELRVPRSSTEVRLLDVARVLGVARLVDVRDVLREGLAARHQFVLWTRVGTTLDDALRAAVNEGLVETRTQGPEER
ncbi:MAG TPA: hypothetical protein VMX54_05190 [Vicinamibacteria bacterium]|nr:hypothetical protein [Vicinamibacteria bacterium]